MHQPNRFSLRAVGLTLMAFALALFFAACAPADGGDGGGNGGTPGLTLSLSSDGNVSVEEGTGTATLTASATPSGGLSGTVGLSFASSTPGLTGTFDPATITFGASDTSAKSSTLTLNVPAAAGTYSGTVTATVGNLTRTADVTVTVTELAAPAIAVNIVPDSVSVGEGTADTIDVEVSSLGGYAGDVTLAVSGADELLPTIDPTTVTFTGSGTTNATVAVTVPAGSAGTDYTLTVTATGTDVADASDTVTISSIAAETVFVAPSGDDANSGLSAADPVATVAKALALVQEGGTVVLAEGTYSGAVNVDKDVTLQGADGATSTGVIVDGGITTALGSDVTLQNLTARHSAAASDDGTAAIAINGDATLTNVNVSDAFVGVWVVNNNDNTATAVSMTNLAVSGTTDDAVRVTEPDATVSITNATISFPDGYSGFGDGIDISTATSATVQTATVTNADAGVQLFSEPQGNATAIDYNVPNGASATLLGVTVTNPARFGVAVGADIDAGESANFTLGSDTQLLQINFDAPGIGDFYLVDARPANSGELGAENVRFGGARLGQDLPANPSGEKALTDAPGWKIENATGLSDENFDESDNHINFGL